MTTQKVRRGMHVRLNWPILRSGVPEDFSNAESLTLHISRVNNNVKTFIPDTHISISGNVVSFIVTSDMLKSLTSGEYQATIAYRKVSATSPTLWEPYIKDEPCFSLVDSSSEVGGSTTGMEVVTIELAGEIGLPKEGLPGASAYRIALAHGFAGDEAEWLLSLKQPAIDAAGLAIQAAADFETLTDEFNEFNSAARTSEAERDTKEGFRIVDEQLRKTSEIGRETKEGIREGNEEERKQAELDREFFFDKSIDESIAATTAANAAANSQNSYNVTVAVPLAAGSYYTKSTARAAVPVVSRKLGLVLTYSTADKVWYSEKYIGSTVAVWTTDSNWEQVPDASKLASIETDLNVKETGLVPISSGKNKLFERYVQDNSYINSASGSIAPHPTYKVVKFIPILPSTQYSLTSNGGIGIGTVTTYHQFLDVNLKHISGITGDTRAFITPSDAYFINVTQSNYVSKCQLEIGLQRTDYELPDSLSNKLSASNFSNTLGKGDKKAIGQKVVSDTIGNTYFIYKGSIGAAYSDLLFPFTIKAGTFVKNNGAIPIIFAQDSTLTGRIDINPGGKFTASIDYNHVRAQAVAGNYEIITMVPIQPEMIPTNSIGTPELKDSAVGTNKIQNDSVSVDKTTFFESINLINKNDIDYKVGYYLNSSGSLSANPTYDTTGFIKVTPLESYAFSGAGGARFIMYYDENRNPISSTYVAYPTALVAPEGAYFVRITVYATSLNQFEKGTEPTAYSPYKKVISQSLIQPNSEDISVPYFFLPKDVYVAVGRTIEIYYEQVILNAFKWNIQAICAVGQPLKRKFRVIGDLAHVGTYTLTLRAFNDKGVQAGQKTCTIHIINDSISSLKKVLPVGDSITNNKPWLTELTNLNANLTRVGTRGDGHEGRSGGTCVFYLNTDGTAKYTYEKNYIGVGSNAEVFNSTLSYSAGNFVKYKTESETSYSVFLFKTAHTANTAWNYTEAINISDTNPFWDFNLNKFSLNHYRTFQGVTPDCIILWLGTNGINNTPETNLNGALGIKQIIDNIRLEDSNIPIVVINTIFRGNQNGIGVGSNADGFSTPTSYKFDEDVKVLLLEQALEKMIGDIVAYPNVYLCPVAATHDSEYNFMNLATAKQGVNPRLTGTDTVYELFPVEATHPQTAGYLQAADEIYSTLCAVFK